MTQDTAPAIDIDAGERATIQRLLRRHLPGVTVWAYGSRVRWNARPQSDLDLVAFASPEQRGAVSQLREAFEESSLPFSVDLLIWDDLPESFHRNIEAEYVVMQLAREENVNSAWREAAWGELATLEYGKSLRGYKTSTGPYRVYGTNGQIGWHSESLCTDPSVIIGRKGAYRGVHYSPDSFFVIDTAFYLKPKVKIDTRWGYYQLLTIDINGMDSGSAIPSTSREDFYGLTVMVPPLPEQRAIAHILGTLDDKIELNRRLNQTLEEMARAIFQDWFVDFGPTRAKQEGRESYLPPELWALFPDRLVESELGEVPEGWGVGVLNDSIEILSGGTPRTSVSAYWDGGIPWYTAKDAPALSDIFVLTTERSITQAGVDNSSTKVLPAKTTIISARGTVGRMACLGIPMAMNQTCYGIRGAEGYPDFFTYCNVRNTVSELQARTHGTIFDTITRETFKIAETVLAPINVARAFESSVTPLMDRILGTLNESCALTAQRDVLLPKLVGGEIWIKGVSGFLDAVRS